jgi:hypothetical protein
MADFTEDLRRRYDEVQMDLDAERVQIRKSSMAPPGFDRESDLYEASQLEASAHPYSIVQPGSDATDTMMRFHNPSLLALRKRAKITRSVLKAAKPTFRHPSLVQGVTSLLSKKPLSDLPDPIGTLRDAPQVREQEEKLGLDFIEDPVAYFSKRKDRRGHLFIYMQWARDPSDPEFSPYEIVKVTRLEAGQRYFTMSASGVTRVDPDSNTEVTSLDQWAKEESIYKSIRKLKTFNRYLLWKPVRVWRDFVQAQHYKEKRLLVVARPAYYNDRFPECQLQIAGLIETGRTMMQSLIVPITISKKYTIADFHTLCANELQELADSYEMTMERAVGIVDGLYQLVADKRLLVVTDDDMKEFRRVNPNIQHLKILEVKKEEESIRRTKKMDVETKEMPSFLRVLDYMFLESLRSACFTAFAAADQQLSSPQSTVFQTDVFFGLDSTICFNSRAPNCGSASRRYSPLRSGRWRVSRG